MARLITALALLSGAAAYVPNAAPAKASVAVQGKAEMVDLAESNPDFLGRTIGFWDPFNLIEEGDFWGLGNEATIGYLRHAEIKHGRVAMAAFLGFIVQSLPVVSGSHILAPYRGFEPGLSPQAQWDAAAGRRGRRFDERASTSVQEGHEASRRASLDERPREAVHLEQRP